MQCRVSQPPNGNPTLDLLCLNKVDYVAPAKLMFSLFLLLQSLSYKTLGLPPHFVILGKVTVCFMSLKINTFVCSAYLAQGLESIQNLNWYIEMMSP